MDGAFIVKLCFLFPLSKPTVTTYIFIYRVVGEIKFGNLYDWKFGIFGSFIYFNTKMIG